MGIFDFIKDVGEKLGISSAEESPTAEAVKASVESHGLDAKDIDVQVDGDTVKITGAAASTSVREKLILAAGNVLGIGKVEEEISVDKDEPEAGFYTVEKGDTLWKIAEEQYGKGKGPEYNRIFEANTPMLSHPDKIYPGQKLRIPPLG